MSPKRKNGQASAESAETGTTEPTAEEHQAVESFQPIVYDVGTAHESLAQLTAELGHHINTQSPGMSGEQLRAFYARLVMAERALGDSIAPVKEITEPAIDPATGAPINAETIPEPAEAAQATSDQT